MQSNNEKLSIKEDVYKPHTEATDVDTAVKCMWSLLLYYSCMLFPSLHIACATNQPTIEYIVTSILLLLLLLL